MHCGGKVGTQLTFIHKKFKPPFKVAVTTAGMYQQRVFITSFQICHVVNPFVFNGQQPFKNSPVQD